jgi:hypothetical protein
MPRDLEKTRIYHITDIANLTGILAKGGLLSDAAMAKRMPEVIGYDHIKKRRLTEISVPCCNGRFVGEFVPFYFCPRSPMLFTINKGNTGRPAGCQESIVHLVSTVAAGIAIGNVWAISSGNASTYHTTFAAELDALEALDWMAIEAMQWDGLQHQKAAEFLVADFFPWQAIKGIGCHNSAIADKVRLLLADAVHQPTVAVTPNWYY